MPSVCADLIAKEVESYRCHEHGQRHHSDVDGKPDRQYCQLAPHTPHHPFCAELVGFMVYVSRRSIASVIMARLIETEINNMVRSLIIFVPFLSVLHRDWFVWTLRVTLSVR